jgi:cytochrome P450
VNDGTARISRRRHQGDAAPDAGGPVHRPHPARAGTVGGRDLAAEIGVSPAIYLTHRHPDLWPEPERFRPERFLGARPSPFQFFPFGGGVRRCIGAAFATYEMKVVLAEVLRRTDLRIAPGYRMRVVQRAVTFAPSGGMPVVMDARRAAVIR